MIRPYSCIAPVVSARLLLSQGKGATLPPSALSPQAKKVQAIIKKTTARVDGESEPAPRLRAVTHEEWQRAQSEGPEAVSLLLQRNVNMAPVPYHSWPLPRHVRDLQEAAVQEPAPPAAIYGCRQCRAGFFVGHSGGGKKCEHPNGCTKMARGASKRCSEHGGGQRCEDPGAQPVERARGGARLGVLLQG